MLVSQTSFGGETSGSISKCRRFSQATPKGVIIIAFTQLNMISLHMKITCYLHMLKDHHRFGHIINNEFSGLSLSFEAAVANEDSSVKSQKNS